MGANQGFVPVRLLLMVILLIVAVVASITALSFLKIIPNPLEELQYMILKKTPGVSKAFYQNPFARPTEKKVDYVNPFTETETSYNNPFEAFE